MGVKDERDFLDSVTEEDLNSIGKNAWHSKDKLGLWKSSLITNMLAKKKLCKCREFQICVSGSSFLQYFRLLSLKAEFILSLLQV